jgi:ABC-type antimicrobial peptide transport system permease subunit
MSVMGVALTVVGLYALVSYAVVRRTREIGIRMAVGATYTRVLQLLLRQGMTPAWVGLIIGLGLSVLLTKVLPALTSVAKAYDVRLFLVVVSLLLTVTLLAAFVPARRAALVNPTEALRHE